MARPVGVSRERGPGQIRPGARPSDGGHHPSTLGDTRPRAPERTLTRIDRARGQKGRGGHLQGAGPLASAPGSPVARLTPGALAQGAHPASARGRCPVRRASLSWGPIGCVGRSIGRRAAPAPGVGAGAVAGHSTRTWVSSSCLGGREEAFVRVLCAGAGTRAEGPAGPDLCRMRTAAVVSARSIAGRVQRVEDHPEGGPGDAVRRMVVALWFR